MDARRRGDENRKSNFVAETMKFLANSSYGYQFLDRSRNTATKYPAEEKTHATIISKLFKKLDHVNNSLYEVEIAKAQIEHKESNLVGFLVLQYAKLRMLQLCYKISTRFCDVNKFENLEKTTDSLSCSCREKTRRLYKT